VTGPKRFTAPVDGPPSLVEDSDGNLVYWSEYEALVEAFALYMEEGMDFPDRVFEVLEPCLGAEDARFISTMLEEAASEDPNDKPQKKGSKKCGL